MTQSARGPRFAAKTLDEFGAFHKLRRDYLYRYRTFRAEVRCKIHRTHAAAPKFAFDAVFIVKCLADKIGKSHKVLKANSNRFAKRIASSYGMRLE
jgi:hypothetical protein